MRECVRPGVRELVDGIGVEVAVKPFPGKNHRPRPCGAVDRNQSSDAVSPRAACRYTPDHVALDDIDPGIAPA